MVQVFSGTVQYSTCSVLFQIPKPCVTISFFSLKTISAWEDVENMLVEEVMTEAALKSAFKEASKGQ